MIAFFQNVLQNVQHGKILTIGPHLLKLWKLAHGLLFWASMCDLFIRSVLSCFVGRYSVDTPVYNVYLCSTSICISLLLAASVVNLLLQG